MAGTILSRLRMLDTLAGTVLLQGLTLFDSFEGELYKFVLGLRTRLVRGG